MHDGMQYDPIQGQDQALAYGWHDSGLVRVMTQF